MAGWTPDPSFYPSPRMAMKAAPETIAYVAAFDPDRKTPDAIAVVDVDPNSKTYSTIIGTTSMPNAGDELHHFGWNACSSCLCPNAPHAHAERRYLVVPGLRSSRIHILDTKPDPKKPKIVKVIEPAEVAEKAGYTRPHTVHCGPEGIYVAALGNREGKAPGGVFLMDHETFEIRGQWEIDRGPQQLAYDAWWHLGHDTMVTSEWGTPDTFENGLDPRGLAGRQIRSPSALLGSAQAQASADHRFRREEPVGVRAAPSARPDQGVWLRQLCDQPGEPLGFDLDLVQGRRKVGGEEDHRDPGRAGRSRRSPVLKGFKAVPPLVTDIDLSMDDKFLYVACWGTGDLQQYDVSDPINPKLTGKVRIGGIVSRATHPGAKNGALSGGPQMVEISRDGKRVYFTNSLYGAIDPQFYPEGIDGWMVKLDAKPAGGIDFDKKFFVDWPAAASSAPGAAGRRRLLVGLLLLSVRLAAERSWRRSRSRRWSNELAGSLSAQDADSFAPSSAKGTMRWHRATAPSSRRSRPWRSRPCSTRCASPQACACWTWRRGPATSPPRRPSVGPSPSASISRPA